MTYRKSENKQIAKLRAEEHSRVLLIKSALTHVNGLHPSIFSVANRLWNVDETQVTAAFCLTHKILSTGSSHGGFVVQNGTGQGKHITAVVAVSAGGLIAPPFIIVQGKNSE